MFMFAFWSISNWGWLEVEILLVSCTAQEIAHELVYWSAFGKTGAKCQPDSAVHLHPRLTFDLLFGNITSKTWRWNSHILRPNIPNPLFHALVSLIVTLTPSLFLLLKPPITTPNHLERQHISRWKLRISFPVSISPILLLVSSHLPIFFSEPNSCRFLCQFLCVGRREAFSLNGRSRGPPSTEEKRRSSS